MHAQLSTLHVTRIGPSCSFAVYELLHVLGERAARHHEDVERQERNIDDHNEDAHSTLTLHANSQDGY